MPVDRELIEVVTIANMAGVEAAQKGFLGLSASALALAAVIGATVITGKAAIENYNAQEEALNLLRQATEATGQSYALAQADVESFIETNKAYISNQYDVIAAAGQIIRAGHSETESMRILNDALDLAVLKHEDVSAAATSVIKVLAGNGKALKELGITTEQYNAIMKSKKSQEEKDAELLALIEQRTNKARETTDKATQSQQRLTADWQRFTEKIGPGLVEMQDKFNEALDTGVQILDLADQFLVKLGQDARNPVWGRLQDFLLLVSGHDVRDGLIALLKLLNADITGGVGPGGTPRAARASGGPVRAGQAYMVGEQGPEPFVPDQDGVILPHGSGNGSGGVTVIIQGGIFLDHGPTLDILTNKIAQRLAAVGGL